MANEEQDRIVMEMESRLQEDRDGSFKASVAAGLEEQIVAIDALLKRGAPPEEYQRLRKLKVGLESARLVLNGTWSYYHS